MAPPPPEAEQAALSPISAVLADLPQRLPREARLRHLIEALGDRGIAVLLTVSSLPAIVPTPGIPAGLIFGIVLIAISAAMMAGRDTIVLPQRLGERRISFRLLEILARRGVPLLQRVERQLAERWPSLVSAAAMPWLGIVVAVMATLITLPIPFGNAIPGISVLLIGLGLATRDGGAVGAGLAVGVVAILASIALIFATYHLATRAIA